MKNIPRKPRAKKTAVASTEPRCEPVSEEIQPKTSGPTA